MCSACELCYITKGRRTWNVAAYPFWRKSPCTLTLSQCGRGILLSHNHDSDVKHTTGWIQKENILKFHFSNLKPGHGID